MPLLPRRSNGPQTTPFHLPATPPHSRSSSLPGRIPNSALHLSTQSPPLSLSIGLYFLFFELRSFPFRFFYFFRVCGSLSLFFSFLLLLLGKFFLALSFLSGIKFFCLIKFFLGYFCWKVLEFNMQCPVMPQKFLEISLYFLKRKKLRLWKVIYFGQFCESFYLSQKA